MKEFEVKLTKKTKNKIVLTVEFDDTQKHNYVSQIVTEKIKEVLTKKQ